jgi:site-specific recombinase XerD
MDIDKALESVDSPNTARAYRRCLTTFAGWLKDRPITIDVVRGYRAHLVAEKKSPQTINAHIFAIRYYVRDLAERGEMPLAEAETVCRVKTVKTKGRKIGKWLTIPEAQAIIGKPDISTPVGLRDRAILGMMIGSGMRRAEVSALEVKHFEQRDGRWVITDIVGKGRRTRSIPIADWVKRLIDQWIEAASIRSGPVFRAVSWSENKFWLRDTPLDPSALFKIVQRYGLRANHRRIAPHDLRRTFARLAYEGNASLAQIQLALGHSNQTTTEKYINAQQDLQMAPSDMLGIEI